MEIILIWLGLAVAAYPIANSKHRFAPGWFLLTLVFGIFAFVVLLCMPRLPSDQERRLAAEPTKQCPLCAETIKAAAIKCRHCGADLPGSLELGAFDVSP